MTHIHYTVHIEADGEVTLTVERVDGTDGDVSIEYFIKNAKTPDTAAFGRDYVVHTSSYLTILYFYHGKKIIPS